MLQLVTGGTTGLLNGTLVDNNNKLDFSSLSLNTAINMHMRGSVASEESDDTTFSMPSGYGELQVSFDGGFTWYGSADAPTAAPSIGPVNIPIKIRQTQISAQSSGDFTTAGAFGAATPPAQVENINVVMTSESVHRASWDATTDNVGVVEYKLEVSTDEFDQNATTIADDITALYRDINDLSVDVHWARVSAVDAAGAWSTPVVFPFTLPTATSVSVTGTTYVGEVLTLNYTYNANSYGAEGTSTFKWYRGDLADGSDAVEISGATANLYTQVSADGNKYVTGEVTPVATRGTTAGVEVAATAATVTDPYLITLNNSDVVSLTGGNMVALVSAGTLTQTAVDTFTLDTYTDGGTDKTAALRSQSALSTYTFRAKASNVADLGTASARLISITDNVRVPTNETANADFIGQRKIAVWFRDNAGTREVYIATFDDSSVATYWNPTANQWDSNVVWYSVVDNVDIVIAEVQKDATNYTIRVYKADGVTAALTNQPTVRAKSAIRGSATDDYVVIGDHILETIYGQHDYDFQIQQAQ